jgi:hypothetical protein
LEADLEGPVSWAMLHKLQLHELQAVANKFVNCENLPKRRDHLASYLGATGEIPLEQFSAFLSAYRLAYIPSKKRGKQLQVVEEAAAAQERQLLSGGNKDSNNRQKELYADALGKYMDQNGGKHPTPVQSCRLWETAAQRAHEALVGGGAAAQQNEIGQRRQSKRQKTTLVSGVGFLNLDNLI